MEQQKLQNLVNDGEFDDKLKIPVNIVYGKTLVNSDKYVKSKSYKYLRRYLRESPGKDDFKFNCYKNEILTLYQNKHNVASIFKELQKKHPNDANMYGKVRSCQSSIGFLIRNWCTYYSDQSRIRQYYIDTGTQITPEIEKYLKEYESIGEYEFIKKYGLPSIMLKKMGIPTSVSDNTECNDSVCDCNSKSVCTENKDKQVIATENTQIIPGHIVETITSELLDAYMNTFDILDDLKLLDSDREGVIKVIDSMIGVMSHQSKEILDRINNDINWSSTDQIKKILDEIDELTKFRRKLLTERC